MADNNEVEIALLKKASEDSVKKQDKQEEILLGLVSAVQDLKTKFYLLGVAFPSILAIIGLLKTFGVFGK